jgi:hypothetical protein
VKTELERRHPVSVDSIERKASGFPQATAAKLDSGTAIPAGRASLIKASYHAGMKPAAIARALRVPLSIVNKVLRAVPERS